MVAAVLSTFWGLVACPAFTHVGGDPQEEEVVQARLAMVQPCLRQQVRVGANNDHATISGEVRAFRHVALHAQLGQGSGAVPRIGSHAKNAFSEVVDDGAKPLEAIEAIDSIEAFGPIGAIEAIEGIEAFETIEAVEGIE